MPSDAGASTVIEDGGVDPSVLFQWVAICQLERKNHVSSRNWGLTINISPDPRHGRRGDARRGRPDEGTQAALI